jgi:hypothetical protein
LTSDRYQALLAEYGFSMSRNGNCWGNAVAETFFLDLNIGGSSGATRIMPKPMGYCGLHR